MRPSLFSYGTPPRTAVQRRVQLLRHLVFIEDDVCGGGRRRRRRRRRSRPHRHFSRVIGFRHYWTSFIIFFCGAVHLRGSSRSVEALSIEGFLQPIRRVFV